MLRGALLVALTMSCASRSALLRENDATVPDAAIDTRPEAWSREVSGPTCADRPSTCPVDDFGPLKTVQSVFEQCSGEVGKACGDLRLVFDQDGCLAMIDEVVYYPTPFVDCVQRVTSAKRWQCAIGGGAYHMFEACP
jgi:hypothetical protein